MLSVILENNRRCSVCNVLYPSAHSLLRHYRTHFPDDEKNIQCNYCEMVFSQRCNVVRHMRMQHGILKNGQIVNVEEKNSTPGKAIGEDKEQLTCQFCPEEFANKDSLRLHTIRTHKHQMNKVASDQQNDTLSNSSHSDSESSTFEVCTCHCKRIFLRMFDYRQHIIQQHKMDLTFFEQECLDLRSFEAFKSQQSSKYNLCFIEESGDAETIGHFKCKEDEETLNGTCSAGLSVFANGDGYLISGVVTHSNHETLPFVLPNLNANKSLSRVDHTEKSKSTLSLATNQPSKPGPELLKDLFGPNAKRKPGRPSTSSTEAPKTKASNISLDLFDLKANKKKALLNPSDEPKAKSAKISLDLFNVESEKSSGSKSMNNSTAKPRSNGISMSLFDLGVGNKKRNSYNSNGTPTRELSSDLSNSDRDGKERTDDASHSSDDSFAQKDNPSDQSKRTKISPKPLDLFDLGFRKPTKNQIKNGLNDKSNGSKVPLELFNL